MSDPAHMWVLVEVWLSDQWTTYTSGALDDIRWELDEVSPVDLTAITALSPGAQHEARNGDKLLRITRVDGWEITCTAWDLLGQWSFALDTTHEVRLPRGRGAAYHWAAASQDQRQVHLARLEPDGEHVRIVSRYIRADDIVLLCPIPQTGETQHG